ncbi:MAG: SDR family oxidoreductase [Thermodesulfobacteriota bacterium]
MARGGIIPYTSFNSACQLFSEAALFLASDEASFSTGSALHVDGGMTSM